MPPATSPTPGDARGDEAERHGDRRGGEAALAGGADVSSNPVSSNCEPRRRTGDSRSARWRTRRRGSRAARCRARSCWGTGRAGGAGARRCARCGRRWRRDRSAPVVSIDSAAERSAAPPSRRRLASVRAAVDQDARGGEPLRLALQERGGGERAVQRVARRPCCRAGGRARGCRRDRPARGRASALQRPSPAISSAIGRRRPDSVAITPSAVPFARSAMSKRSRSGSASSLSAERVAALHDRVEVDQRAARADIGAAAERGDALLAGDRGRDRQPVDAQLADRDVEAGQDRRLLARRDRLGQLEEASPAG